MIKKAVEKLISLKTAPQKYANAGLKINLDGKKRSAFSILGYKDSSWELIESVWPELESLKLDSSNKETNTNKCILREICWKTNVRD